MNCLKSLYPSMIRLPSRARVSFPPVSPEACKVNKPPLPSPIPRQKNRKVGLVAKVNKSRTAKLIIGSSRSHGKKCSLINYRRKQITPDTITDEGLF